MLTEQLSPIAQMVVYPSGRLVAACDSAATSAVNPIAVAITFFFIIKVLMSGSPGGLAREGIYPRYY